MVKVDFPPPDTPVMQVNSPTGISPVTDFRLLPLAPEMRITFLGDGLRRFSGMGMSLAPVRY